MMPAVPGPSDSELYRLFDRSPIGMYRTTRDGRILYANPALARMLGYSLDELKQKNVVHDIYLDPTERERLVAEYGPMGMVDGVTVKWRHGSGRILTIRLHGHIVESEHGPSFDASVMDITPVVVANAELEQTKTTLDMVVRQVGAVWWLVDGDMRLLRVDGPTRELFAYAPDQDLGRTLRDMLPPTSAVFGATKRALEGETVRFSTEYLGRMFDNVVAPRRYEGQVVGAIGTSIDVTSARVLERRMVDAQRAESLGVLAGGLAHDFNNLLVAILGNADLGLRDTPPGAPGHAALENIRDASLRAAELTNQLLAYAGRGGVAQTRVEPAPIVAELLKISAVSMPTNVAVNVDIPRDLALRGDIGQVRQVILNLLTNASEALRERGGTVTITGRLVRHDGAPQLDDVLTPPAGTYVALEVADDGAGMDRDTRRKVFEPFFTTKPTGHGLGLASVLGIVRAHGGGLRLVTSPGSGARFEVLWPATTTPVQMLAAQPTTRTVLVVDDEDLVRDVVARMVEDLGYAALTAADGATALELVEQAPVDVVLVDLTMPRMSGADVIVALRARRPSLPVILCTGYDRDRKGPVNADAYLAKPFRIEALEKTLTRLLDRPEGPSRSTS